MAVDIQTTIAQGESLARVEKPNLAGTDKERVQAIIKALAPSKKASPALQDWMQQDNQDIPEEELRRVVGLLQEIDDAEKKIIQLKAERSELLAHAVVNIAQANQPEVKGAATNIEKLPSSALGPYKYEDGNYISPDSPQFYNKVSEHKVTLSDGTKVPLDLKAMQNSRVLLQDYIKQAKQDNKFISIEAHIKNLEKFILENKTKIKPAETAQPKNKVDPQYLELLQTSLPDSYVLADGAGIKLQIAFRQANPNVSYVAGCFRYKENAISKIATASNLAHIKLEDLKKEADRIAAIENKEERQEAFDKYKTELKAKVPEIETKEPTISERSERNVTLEKEVLERPYIEVLSELSGWNLKIDDTNIVGQMQKNRFLSEMSQKVVATKEVWDSLSSFGVQQEFENDSDERFVGAVTEAARISLINNLKDRQSEIKKIGNKYKKIEPTARRGDFKKTHEQLQSLLAGASPEKPNNASLIEPSNKLDSNIGASLFGDTPTEAVDKLEKYRKMLKAGLPQGAVLNAMARDNVSVPQGFFDESPGVESSSNPVQQITSAAESNEPTAPPAPPKTLSETGVITASHHVEKPKDESVASSLVNKNYAGRTEYEKYVRMAKAGLPQGAVRNAMERDNVSVPQDFFDDSPGVESAHSPAKQVTSTTESNKHASSVPLAPPKTGHTVVRTAAASPHVAKPKDESVTSSLVNKNYAGKTEYEKYVRMAKAGLPQGAVRNAMERDNVSVPQDFFDDSPGVESAHSPAQQVTSTEESNEHEPPAPPRTTHTVVRTAASSPHVAKPKHESVASSLVNQTYAGKSLSADENDSSNHLADSGANKSSTVPNLDLEKRLRAGILGRRAALSTEELDDSAK